MANTSVAFQIQPLNGTPVTFTSADTTSEKTVWTAGANGSLIDSIAVTSDDTSAVILVLSINNLTTSYKIGELSIPAGAGTDGSTPAVNLLSQTAMPFLQRNGGLPIQGTYKLNVNAKVTMTAAKTLTITPIGGNY